MAKRRTPPANAVRPAPRPLPPPDEYRRMGAVEKGNALLRSWGIDPFGRNGHPYACSDEAKPPRVTKAQVRRVIEAARAAGFDPEEVEIEGVVLRRRGGVTVLTEPPAGDLDIEAEIAAWAGRNGLG